MQTTSSQPDINAHWASRALSEVRVDLLGFAFHPAWIYLLFYSNGALGDILGHEGDSLTLTYFFSMVPLTLMALIGAIATKRFMTIATKPILVVGAPLATAVGTLLYVADTVAPAPFYLAGAGILTGIGSAFVAARWAALFGRFSARTMVANLPLLLLLQVALCLSISYLTDHLQVALLVGLPLASGGCLAWSERSAAADAIGADGRRARTRTTLPAAELAGLIGIVALIGFASALLGGFGQVNDRFDYGAWLDIAVTLLVLLFVGRALLLASPRSFPWLFVVPVGALLFILLPQMRFSTDFLADVVYPIGTIVFELLLLFAATLFARMKHCSPAKVFMAARLAYALSDMAGSMVGETAAGSLDALTIAHMATVVLMGTVGLLATGALIAAVTGRLPLKGSETKRDEEEEPVRADETLISTDQADLAEEELGKTRGAPADPNALTGVPSTPHEAIMARCQALGRRFSLSEREREVLVLIAEGRSSARIQEDLSIAAGTVNYHTRNIYAKLGVHSRQEIIDMTLGLTGDENSGLDN